jgi:Tfp pilus assembly protein PilX
MIRRQLSDERGWVLVTSMAVLFIILTLGIVALQTVDVQTHQSSQESAGEAAFNLAESALDAETSRLQTSWPGNAAQSTAGGWNAACNNQTATQTTSCPGPSLTASFNSTYAGSQFRTPTWGIQVFDDSWNPNTGYYSDSLSAGGSMQALNYDNNQNNHLWVRAQATINHTTRVVVAEVVRQPHVVSLPRNVITAGGVYTSNNGNKIIINANDSVQNSGLTGQVALRCGNQGMTPSYGSLCAGWDASHGQLSPPTFNPAYTDASGGNQTLQDAQMQALKATAVANGTYYNGTCPPAGQAGVVYVENANCTYNSNTTWDSDAAPGMLIFASGTVYFSGTLNFYGIIYMADGQDTVSGACTQPALQNDYTQNNGPVFTVHGTGTLYGALFVGNCGVVDAGSSAFNIQFDSNAFKGAIAYQTPALAKNTFQIVHG